jgi:DNA-binding transcriptional MerR regulator
MDAQAGPPDVTKGIAVERFGPLDVPQPAPADPADFPSTVDQSALFDDADLRPKTLHLGYRGPVACAAAGISYRQLDYWARTGLVEPSIRPASGSGSQRLYSFRDILILRIVKRLIDTGVSLPNIRSAVAHLESRGGEDLARITLMSDGATIYECRSADEVVDLVRGGQGVFGIAIGRVWHEVEGTLAELPGESAEGIIVGDSGCDELAARRAARSQVG